MVDVVEVAVTLGVDSRELASHPGSRGYSQMGVSAKDSALKASPSPSGVSARPLDFGPVTDGATPSVPGRAWPAGRRPLSGRLASSRPRWPTGTNQSPTECRSLA
jgi:hypothetical protein